jgi:tetratricopeptide (TPR) repeat protein
MSDTQQRFDDAMFAFSQADYPKAVRLLEAVLAEDSGHFDAQLALGMSHYRMGDYPKAIAEGHKAEALQPDEQLVHTNLSLFYMKAGDKVTAEKHGLKARVASWKDTSPPPAGNAPDSELQIAKPAAKSIAVSGRKLPATPWKKNKPISQSGA